jgi:RimJ/RimL family protein N-acetyltransferase
MGITLDLAPLDSTDMGLVRSWRNNPKIWAWCRQNDLISDAAQVKWFNAQTEDPTIRMYKLMLTTPEGTAPVGVGGLTSIDFFNSRAEFSLYLQPEAHGRGLGKKFLGLLFDHGFLNLGLNLIFGETMQGNPAITMFEQMGLIREGTRRAFYWKNGKRIDAHIYSITRDEWHGLKSRPIDLSGGDTSADSSAPKPKVYLSGRKPKVRVGKPPRDVAREDSAAGEAQANQ